jgi:hypothetical protein
MRRHPIPKKNNIKLRRGWISMKRSNVVIICVTILLGIYLFVSAPPPIETTKQSQQIPIEKALAILDKENQLIRKLYTKEIVGAATKHKVKFDEEWEEDHVVAGPLPAQFLRLTAQHLESTDIPLGLFLGSDYAISKSNQFEGEHLLKFQKMKLDNKPIFSYVEDIQRYTYMSADVASVKPCVTCHNEHSETPKKDWKIGDTMGATTWTYPDQTISYEQLLKMIYALHQGAQSAYQQLLAEVASTENAPIIGKKWPKDGPYLPNENIFLTEVQRITSPITMEAMYLPERAENIQLSTLD